MVKNAFKLIIVIVLMTMFVSVCIRLYDDFFGKKAELIKNFRIDDLTESEIINKEFGRGYVASTRYTNNSETGVPNTLDHIDSDNVETSYKKFIGIETVSATKVKNSVLKLDIESELTEGVGKIVVICDNEIVEYLEFNESRTLTYEVRGEHIYSVKILCESAKINIKVSRSFEPLP